MYYYDKEKTRKLFADVVAVMVNMDLKQPRDVLYGNISKQLNLSKKDWIYMLIAVGKDRYPMKIKDPLTGKVKKITNRDKLRRFFEAMKSEIFKHMAINTMVNFAATMMNPLTKKPANVSANKQAVKQETENED